MDIGSRSWRESLDIEYGPAAIWLFEIGLERLVREKWEGRNVLIPCVSVKVQEGSVSLNLKRVQVSQNTDKSPVSTPNAINT